MQILLTHMKRDFSDFLGSEHDGFAAEVLKGRRDTIKREVQERVAEAKRFYVEQAPEWKAARAEKAAPAIESWIKANQLRRKCKCPARNMRAVMSGETASRSPVRIDELSSTITREVRVLPNSLLCLFCMLKLNGYQEMREAGLGTIYRIEEDVDPIEFFGIIPEDHVDVDELIRSHYSDEYNNE
jgi:hypothetical protein